MGPDNLFVGPDNLFVGPDNLFVGPDNLFVGLDNLFVGLDTGQPKSGPLLKSSTGPGISAKTPTSAAW